MGSLQGIKVLDLSSMLAGPFGAQMLGDLGADVIKIESLDGDFTRPTPPHIHKGQSMYYMAFNRNKRSLSLDLKSEEGLKIFYELVKKADVVYDNYRPGVTKRLKVDYDTLKEINPKIICSSITAYGTDNPYGGAKPSYDLCIQAESGVLSATGEPDQMPAKLGVPMGDISGGWYAVVGILAALLERDRTGKGQRVDIALLDGLFSLHCYEAVYYMYSGVVPTRLGTAHRSIVPYQVFKCKDSYIALVCPNNNFVFGLFRALGIPQYIDDERFGSVRARYDHREELVKVIEDALALKTAEEWIPLIEKEAVPCAPVNDMDKAVQNPALLHRNMVVDVVHQGDVIKLLGNPVKLSNNEEVYKCPPELGEHTGEILSELLGYSEETLAELEGKSVIKRYHG